MSLKSAKRQQMKAHGIDAPSVVVGRFLYWALKLTQKGFPAIGFLWTIDNDIAGTE